MLIGEYTHSIDEKNRISLPVRFREKMGKKVVVTPGLDHCLFVFAPKEWDKISGRLAEASLGQSDSRSFSRFMFGGAVEADIDSIGRILVPDYLQEWANLKGKVSVVGVHSRVEIWNEKTWATLKKGVAGKSNDLAEKLGSVGVF
ncbi:MAG TPA: division/cell wall cluster transcriptional repressor MraZ [Candidatus Paceibacterota bacterium]|nr:division/cell wall cluster transcriptional repressor MraZ [Candidatus Paceibacterota bacterium]